MTTLLKCYTKIHDQFQALLGTNDVAEILELIDHSTPKKIAEIGGGTGYLANKLVHLGHHVTIINPNEFKTKLAKDRNPAINIINKTVAQVSRSNTFDYLIFHNSLHHMTNHLFLFNNCESLLLNDGHVIIHEFCPEFWQSKALLFLERAFFDKVTPIPPDHLDDMVCLAQVRGEAYPLSKRDYYFLGKKYPTTYAYSYHFKN